MAPFKAMFLAHYNLKLEVVMKTTTKRCKMIHQRVLLITFLVFVFLSGCGMPRPVSSVKDVAPSSQGESISPSEEAVDDRSPGMAVGGSLGIR